MGRRMPTANELDLLRRHSGTMLLRHKAKSNHRAPCLGASDSTDGGNLPPSLWNVWYVAVKCHSRHADPGDRSHRGNPMRQAQHREREDGKQDEPWGIRGPLGL